MGYSREEHGAVCKGYLFTQIGLKCCYEHIGVGTGGDGVSTAPCHHSNQCNTNTQDTIDLLLCQWERATSVSSGTKIS